jgi:hypothetical protein
VRFDRNSAGHVYRFVEFTIHITASRKRHLVSRQTLSDSRSHRGLYLERFLEYLASAWTCGTENGVGMSSTSVRVNCCPPKTRADSAEKCGRIS